MKGHITRGTTITGGDTLKDELFYLAESSGVDNINGDGMFRLTFILEEIADYILQREKKAEEEHKKRMRDFANEIWNVLPTIPSYRFVQAEDIVKYNEGVREAFEESIKKYHVEEKK